MSGKTSTTFVRPGVLLCFVLAGCTSAPVGDRAAVIRYSQLGYMPDAVKAAVLCSPDGELPVSYQARDEDGRVVLGPLPLRGHGELGPCAATARLDFSAVREPGRYTLEAGSLTATVRVRADAYGGVADTLLAYMRQQRSLFNPLFRDSVHHRTDAILVDHPLRAPSSLWPGGWADAAGYLQYVTTSAHATSRERAAKNEGAP